MNNLPTFIVAVFLLLGWLIPDHYFPWTTFYNDVSSWIGLALFAMWIGCVRKSQGVVVPKSLLIVLLFAVVPVMQWMLGIVYFFSDALMASSYLLGLFLAALVGRNAVNNADFLIWFAFVIFLGAFASLCLALCQWLRLDILGLWVVEMPLSGRPFANLAQPNNLATLLCMGWAAVLYFGEKKLLAKGLVNGLTILLFAGVAMTRSRMAILIVALFLLWVALGRKRFRLNASPAVVCMWGSAFIALWLSWPVISHWLLLSADSSVERLGSAFGGEVRWILWRQLVESILQRPWAGYGWNQVSVALLAVAHDFPNSVVTEHAHNLIIDLLCWNGVLIGGGAIVLSVHWLVMRVALIRRLESWFAFMLISALLVHSMFEFPLEYAFFLVPFGMALGIVEAEAGFSKWRLPASAAIVSGFVGLLLVSLVCVEYKKVETDFRRLRYESAGLMPRDLSSISPDVVLLSGAREFIRFARTEAKEGMSDSELEWMRQVSSRFPYPPAMFRYILALAINNRPEEASLHLLVFRKLHSEQRFQEAIEALMQLKNRYPVISQVSIPL